MGSVHWRLKICNICKLASYRICLVMKMKQNIVLKNVNKNIVLKLRVTSRLGINEGSVKKVHTTKYSFSLRPNGITYLPSVHHCTVAVNLERLPINVLLILFLHKGFSTGRWWVDVTPRLSKLLGSR